MKYLYLVWSNLKRKKLRTILTFLSIFIAFLLFGLLVATRSAFNQGVEVAGADRLIVRHKVSIIQFLPEAYKSRIEGIEGVSLAMHQTWFGGIYQDPKNFFAQIPLDPEEFLRIYPEYLLDEEEKARWKATRTGAVIGRKLADRFGWKIGDKIPIQATIWVKKDGGSTWEFDVVGIYEGAEKGTDTSQLFFRYDYFDEARAWGSGNVGWYVVQIEEPDRAAEIAQQIDDEFANSPAETKAEPEGAFLQGFANQMGNIGAIMLSILSAVFFTILLVAGNTMAQAVRERTEELAVLKAVGFTNRGVLGLVLAESMLLAGLAGLAGLALAPMVVSGIGQALQGILPVFFLPTRAVVIGIGLALLLGLVSGIFPALQAQRLRIADALRR